MRAIGAIIRLIGVAVVSAGWLGAAELTPVVLQLKWRHQFQFAGYYAALDQGYYREAGLEVELREARPGEDPVEVVLSGRAEFGVGTSELLLLRARGERVVVLANIFQHSPLVLLARDDGSAPDLQSLHDQPLMIEPQSAEIFAYFRNEGIDPAKLHVVHHTLSPEDLIQGKVAAMTGYLSDEPFVLQERGFAFLQFTPRAGGIDFYGDNLFTTEAQIAARPELVRAFRAASLRGWEYALAHPDEIIDLIVRRYRGDKSRAHLAFEAERTAQLMHPGLIEVGHMNPGRWQHMADTYAEFGMLPADLDVGAMLFDVDPAPDLRPWYWALGGAAALLVGLVGWFLPLARLNRRLRRSEKQYRELAENAPFPVVISVADTGEILFANEGAADLFRRTREQLVGRSAGECYRSPVARMEIIRQLHATGRVQNAEVEFSRHDGTSVWVLLSAGWTEFGGHQAIVVSLSDITARRAMEAELRAARDAAESANATRSRYLAVMSHEIRTPLNGILGLTRLMLDESPNLDEDARESLSMVHTASESQLRLVNELIEWSQLEARAVRMELMPIVLREFLVPLAGLFRPVAEAKDVVLELTMADDLPELVLTDSQRLRQVLSNLLANAVKFTEVGAVRFHVEPVARAEGAESVAGRVRLAFVVRDTGPGIDAATQRKLFAPFVQADASVARRYGGSGLGLSISAELARLMGGGITLESEVGVGSTFRLEIEAGLAGGANEA